MKQYICQNLLQCDWADEIPPKEFPLPDGNNHFCPNCGSSSVKIAVKPPKRNWIRVLAFLSILCLFSAIIYFWLRNKGGATSTVTIGGDPPKHTKVKDPPERGDSTKPTKHEVPFKHPLAGKMIPNSEFCDPSTCTLYYSVYDNLGRVKEMKRENVPKCCPL